MTAGERPWSWPDFEIRRILGAHFTRPLVTEEELTVCENAHVRVEHNAVRNAATDERQRLIRIVPLGADCYVAVIIPVMADGKIMFMARYRYPIERWSVELPQFACHTSETGWKQTAADDLWKFTGLRSEKMSLLGAIQPDAALISTNTIVILAEGCEQGTVRPAMPRELIAGTVAVAPNDLGNLVRRGEIACGASLAALYLYGVDGRR